MSDHVLRTRRIPQPGLHSCQSKPSLCVNPSRMPTGHQQALINLICMTLSEVDNLLQTAFFEGEKTGNGELDSNTKGSSTIAVI